MKEYVYAVLRVRSRLDRLESKLDGMLDKLSVCRDSDTFGLMTAVLGVVELKRMVVDIAKAYDAMRNALSASETRVLEAKTEGKSDERTAAELGVCRATVRKLRTAAERRCENVLLNLQKFGLDVTACKDAFIMAGLKKRDRQAA